MGEIEISLPISQIQTVTGNIHIAPYRDYLTLSVIFSMTGFLLPSQLVWVDHTPQQDKGLYATQYPNRPVKSYILLLIGFCLTGLLGFSYMYDLSRSED